MLIKVSEIPEDGLSFEGAASLPDPYADPGWRLEDLALAVHKDGDVVLVTGRIAARVPAACSRCLEPAELAIRPEVDLRLVPAPVGRGEEHELGADELETDVYSGDEIDLRRLVRSETELALPMKPLCRADCRGLCPSCGANLNAGPCQCGGAAPDPRWAPLRALLGR
jgi:uncharacterized protein